MFLLTVGKRRIVRARFAPAALGQLKYGKMAKSFIKRVVRGQQETKYVTRLIEDNIAHNSPISSGDFYPVFPRISVGTSETQRVGDVIRPTSFTVKGNVALSLVATSLLSATRPLWFEC